MDWFRHRHAPAAAALAALAALVILPSVHGAAAPHHRYTRIVFCGGPGAPHNLAPASPLEGSGAARPCPLCLALAHSRAAAADAAGVEHSAAPLPAARLARLPAQPGPFRLALATLAPRAPPAAS